MTSRLISGLAAFALVVAATPTLAVTAPAAQQDRSCARDDMPCRIDRLERQLDYVIDLLEDRNDRPRRGGGGSRGQEMVVNQDCIFDTCAAIALRLCQNAGFQRGVASELGQNGAWQRLVKAQCSD